MERETLAVYLRSDTVTLLRDLAEASESSVSWHVQLAIDALYPLVEKVETHE